VAQTALKNRIKKIQTHLGVPADGLIGPMTLSAIENALFDAREKETLKQHYTLTVSRRGLEQLVRHEISSAAYYKRFLSHPTWPGGRSGITIGIGYDLGYNTAVQIRKDWAGQLSEMDLEKLIVVSGLKEKTAQQALGNVQSIEVPLSNAETVFYTATLPRFAAATAKTYPGVEDLLPDAQAALLSLIYNRGTSLNGTRRSEMAAIKPLVALADYSGIADQLLAMKRLWENRGLDGLLKRREDEARLIRQADHEYDPADIVRV
jgi:GH24 family phage-related lysozyme (muramidase)